jgi:hypothetical protein
LDMVTENFGNYTEGYRDGVVLVNVPPEGFFTSITKLEVGDKLVGTFKARREGELPAKEIRAIGSKMPAARVDVVLYRHDVLAENNEHTTNADWEIISINASPTLGETPISVGALMRNYFCEVGGTDTKMTPEEFVNALKVSREFWRDKALVQGE